MLMAEGVPGATFASNAMADALEELQFTLGVGPRVDAFANSFPVLGPHLSVNPSARWFGFCDAAVEAGTGSVFSFPLQIGAARVGALTVYMAAPGPLGDDQYADALVMADVVTRMLLTAQAGLPDDSLAASLCDERAFSAVVHQASGMVAVQLDQGVGEALARLRARAFADGVAVTTIAAEVVARRLRFTDL